MTTRRRVVGTILISAIVGVWGSSPGRAQGSSARWEGAITVGGIEIPFMIVVQSAQAATIDIQGAEGVPLTNVEFGTHVHFELETAIGRAVFDGGRGASGEVTGTFEQGAATGTFVMRPVERLDEDRPADRIGQEVTFSSGEFELAGTLTLPHHRGPHPAVILITGSGPQNRDQEILGFRPFRIIAEHLMEAGIAALRYDDRGVGGSTGDVNQATTADFAGDVRAAMNLLRTHDEIDPNLIGLIGHSEGAIVASMVAANYADVAFTVLLAGSGVPGERILLEQGELITRAGGASPEQVAAQRASQEAIFAAVRTGNGWSTAEALLAEQVRASLDLMPAPRRRGIPDEDAFVQANVRAQVAFARTPWFAYFLDHDPSTSLERVKSPVLLFFGELDLQVPPALNRAPMLAALVRANNTDVSERTFSCANHLFQCAETGSPAEYATLDKEFVDGFLEELTNWIRERVEPDA